VVITKISVFLDLMPCSQHTFTDVQEEPTSSIYRAEDGGNRLFQNIQTFFRLYGISSQKTVILTSVLFVWCMRSQEFSELKLSVVYSL
jgi:hypothetical protein